MKAYLDTSFLISLYTPDRNSAEAHRLFKRLSAASSILLNRLSELEAANGIRLRVFRKEVTDAEAARAVMDFETDLSEAVYLISPLTASTFETAMSLSMSHAMSMGVRTLDLLIVASALQAEADEFYTFDKRQRKLAVAVGLKVRP